ncbi:hypothetical protein [Akkermansia glycaniphila]|uniref:Uncharacterized protein n=1 Tax=Akkermansia glycaniphila TaxID=1679444 RepID=A0A1C7PDS9_9BACT|nr:hypothetical protein [Akkermansia glycaniphila]MBT9449476.1 hypothetical protein [Akkermansia glycaniphila]OCA03697.1 hypothetical protein AC781_03120 [Akkermansia glycaniphila]SEH82338.1 Hypothetical protein PYTT_1010 [Akkermansia glycaniphila]
MRRLLHSIPSTIVCIGLAGVGAVLGASDARDADKGKKEDTWEKILVPGSVVKGIALPQKDGTRTTAIARITQATVISKTELQCEQVKAELISLAGEITYIITDAARIFKDTGLLIAKNHVHIASPRFIADGDQLHLDTKKQEGYLRGSVVVKLPSITQKKLKQQP